MLHHGLQGGAWAPPRPRRESLAKFDIVGREQLLQGPAAREAEAGHVHHQVAHRHRPLRVDELLRPVLRSLAHLQVAPLRDEASHGIAELERPPLIQRHQRDPGDRLSHRVNTPYGVLLDGHGPSEVPGPQRPEIAHVTVAGDGDLAAGDAPSVDVAVLQVLGDPFQPAFVESRPNRVDLHALTPVGSAGGHPTGYGAGICATEHSENTLYPSWPATTPDPGHRRHRRRHADIITHAVQLLTDPGFGPPWARGSISATFCGFDQQRRSPGRKPRRARPGSRAAGSSRR